MRTLLETTGTTSYRAAYRIINDARIERHRANDRAYQQRKRKQNSLGKAIENLNYRTLNAEKIRAHTLLNRAINRGDIRRGSCEECSAKNAHAHHTNYSKPLNVRWLCSIHHKLEHTQLDSKVELQTIKKK